MTRLHIVLVEPEIPQNAGAVGRLCVGLGASLHLIRPLGFSLTSRQVRRCGLDYWEHLPLHVHESWDAFLASAQPADVCFFSTSGSRSLYAWTFRPGVFLVFGSETRGLAPELRTRHAERVLRIPMPGPHARSINLANAAAIAAYEAYRQIETGGHVPAPGAVV